MSTTGKLVTKPFTVKPQESISTPKCFISSLHLKGFRGTSGDLVWRAMAVRIEIIREIVWSWIHCLWLILKLFLSFAVDTTEYFLKSVRFANLQSQRLLML